MGADCSFYVKSIATYAPAFFGYNSSVLASVNTSKLCLVEKETKVNPVSKFSVSLTPISGHQDSAEVHDSSSQLVVVLNCFHGRFPPLPFYKVSERMSCEHVCKSCRYSPDNFNFNMAPQSLYTIEIHGVNLIKCVSTYSYLPNIWAGHNKRTDTAPFEDQNNFLLKTGRMGKNTEIKKQEGM